MRNGDGPCDLGGEHDMALVEMDPDLIAFRGKGVKRPQGRVYCKRKNGTVYYYHILNPSTKPATAAQVAARDKFKTALAATSAAMADPTQLATYSDAFRKQKKYSDLHGYIFAQEYAKL